MSRVVVAVLFPRQVAQVGALKRLNFLVQLLRFQGPVLTNYVLMRWAGSERVSPTLLSMLSEGGPAARNWRKLAASPNHDKGEEEEPETHVMAERSLLPVNGDTASTV